MFLLLNLFGFFHIESPASFLFRVIIIFFPKILAVQKDYFELFDFRLIFSAFFQFLLYRHQDELSCKKFRSYLTFI